MASFINFKICDNALECSGIEVCPVGAITYNEKEEKIEIDNDKCISCGKCETACPVGAFRVARTKEEEELIQKEIDEDPRTIKDLFVDRYGAAPLSEFFMIEAEDVCNKIKQDGFVLLELYEDETIECLLKSIPIKELTKDMPAETLFYKSPCSDELKEQYQLEEIPSLLVFKYGELVGKIEGYYNVDAKEEVLSKLNDIVKVD